MRVAIVGDRISITGFKALGVDTFPVGKEADAAGAWSTIKLDDYAVVFVTEPVYEALTEEIQAVRRGDLPVVTVIPAVTAGRRVGVEDLRKLVERAVGTDVMFRE